MSATTTVQSDIRTVLNLGNLNDLADALRKIKVGTMLSVVKAVVTALSAAQNIDITTAAVKAAAVITGIALGTNENLPPIGVVRSLRVAASGTAASVGTYGVSDAGGTAVVPPGGASVSMGIATLSDDGKTLGFPNTITAFTIVYMPKADVTLDTALAIASP